MVIGKDKTVEDPKEIYEIVRSMMQINRMYLLLQTRILSLGDEYTFSYICSNCGKTLNAVVLLDTIKIVPPDLIGVADNGLYDTNVYGHDFTLKILTAQDEINNLIENDVLTTMLAQRITGIDGKKGTLSMLKTLPIKYRQKLRNAIKKREGDIDLTIEAQCKYCGQIDKVEIDLGDPNFFFPADGES